MNLLPIISSFFFLLCFSVIFCLSSRHLFGVWLGLELNMLSFIVLIINRENLRARESSIKYFLLQALGRGLFLFGFVISYLLKGSWRLLPGSGFDIVLILCGLGVKLGCSPFHFWVPRVINALSWSNSLILRTIQKLVPLCLLIYLYSMEIINIIIIIGVLGAMVGGLGGLNQTQARALLGYSSISHLGWIISVRLVSLYYSVFYFMIYLLRVVIVFWFLSKLDVNKIKYFIVDKEYRRSTKNIFFLSLLSLGGLPPLLGFFPKITVLRIIIETNFFSPLMFLILGSLLSLSYYLNIFFSSYISSVKSYKQRIYFIFDKGDLVARIRFSILLIRGFIVVESIIIYALTIFN